MVVRFGGFFPAVVAVVAVVVAAGGAASPDSESWANACEAVRTRAKKSGVRSEVLRTESCRRASTKSFTVACTCNARLNNQGAVGVVLVALAFLSS